MTLTDAKLTFLDLQTTGATPVNSHVLELAWCVASAASEQPEVLAAYLVRQPEDQPIPGRISAITGIDQEDMTNAVPLSRAGRQLLKGLGASDHPDKIIIHFAQFEKPFLAQAFPAHFSRFKIYCTHQIAKRLFPNLPSRGIRGLAGYFGLSMEECKRAESHAWATLLIWRNLCRHLEQIGVETFEQLDQWLAVTPIVKRTRYEYPLDKTIRLAMPDRPGVYRMLSQGGDVLYVGKATSLRSRVNSYFRGQRGKESRKLEMLTQAWNIDYTVCDTVVEACVLEVEEIKRLSPPYNVSLKTGERPLLFYSEQFDSCAWQPDEQHSIGPFRSELVMDGFVRLVQSLPSEQLDALMFFDPLEPELLAEGFETFIERHRLCREQLLNPRNLLAIGLRLRRLLAAQDDGETEEPAQDVSGPLSLQYDAEPEELSPEEVADKFERLLMRAAAAYRLSRRLTKLLSARISFEENGARHVVHSVRGRLQFPAQCVPAQAEPAPRGAAHLWYGLGIDAYDRLRVLQTELVRIKACGLFVQVDSECINENAPRAELEGASVFS